LIGTFLIRIGVRGDPAGRVIRAGGVGAYPDGRIALLEGLVADVESNLDAIEAVLLHEISHVERQHGLRQVLRGAGVFLLVTVFLGDVSSSIGLASTLPVVIANSNYSQGFELEADRDAALGLLARHGTAQPMITLLEALAEDGSRGGTFASTHPAIAERINAIQRLEERHMAQLPAARRDPE
jgi:Zn-dependent protease with chaperone function